MMRATSSVPPRTPTRVINTHTGAILSREEYETPIKHLISYVRDETERLFTENREQLEQDILNVKNVGSCNSFGRSHGYASNYKTLPKEILAKSRVNELVLHKLIGEVSSFVRNPNPSKQPPSFGPQINLGAVNKQMASLSLTGEIVSLLWKCWDVELLFEFDLHEYYVKERAGAKWCLPRVSVEKGEVSFGFSIQESTEARKNRKVRAGLDLGKAKPYCMAVEDADGSVTSYDASLRLRYLQWLKDENQAQKEDIQARLNAYEALGYEGTKKDRLLAEKARKRSKITRLNAELANQVGAEVARLLAQHEAHLLTLEDLTFVRGKKYGGRWNHARQQSAITHALKKRGVRTHTVSARGTSQHCHECRGLITHVRERQVRCDACQSRLDRDFNAAMNLLKKQSYPHYGGEAKYELSVVPGTDGGSGSRSQSSQDRRGKRSHPSFPKIQE